jgi:hypothetical protein
MPFQFMPQFLSKLPIFDFFLELIFSVSFILAVALVLAGFNFFLALSGKLLAFFVFRAFC